MRKVQLGPDNLVITLSAEVDLPLGDTSGMARFDNVQASLDHGVPRITIGGIGFGIDDLTLGVMTCSGIVYLGGLEHLPDHPNEVFLAGKLKGAGVGVLAAFRFDKPLGFCLDVSAGPAGIPLGPTGFLLTSVSGGMALLNTNVDPCDFTSYIQFGADGRPTSSPPPTGGTTASQPDGKPITTGRPTPLTGVPDCPEDCPPPSMNILCQPHPDTARYPGTAILKFSSLDEAFLNRLSLQVNGQTLSLSAYLHTFDNMFASALSGGGESADSVATAVAGGVVGAMTQAVRALLPSAAGPFHPAPPGALLDILRAPADYWAREAQVVLHGLIAQAITQASSGSPPSLYNIVRDALYAGVPCPDVTLQVKATLSYTGVSAFLSVTGGVNVSTAGSAGVIGSVNVFGIPVGKLRAFLTGTNRTGGVDPSLCGDVHFAVGPLELGVLSLIYNCPGCVSSIASAVVQFGAALGGPLIQQTLDIVMQDLPPASDPVAALSQLSEDRAMAFVAHLLSVPLDRLTPDQAARLVDFLKALLGAVWDGFQPQIVLCGEVSPRLFGLPLGGDLVAVKGWITKERMGATFALSPAYIIGRVLPIADMFSGMDTATVGFSRMFPTLEQLLVDGLTGRYRSGAELVDYLDSGFERLLTNAALTIAYEFSPFGMKLINVAGRAVMPFLTAHPARPGSTWFRPENRHPALTSRVDVLKATLDAGKLADATWNGDLSALYPTDSTMSALELGRDYFPHGGILGAGAIVLPRALLDAAPMDKFGVIFGQGDPMTRLKAVYDYVSNYLLKTEQVGSLAFYVPAPNPPTFAVGGRDLTPRELMQSIVDLDFPTGPLQAGPLYSVEEAIFGGYLHGRLLGLPIGDALVDAVPPDRDADGTGYLEVRASVPPGSWLANLVTQADLRFTIKQMPTETIEKTFLALGADLLRYLGAAAPAVPPEVAALLSGVRPSQPAPTQSKLLARSLNSLVVGLPKVALAATLQLAFLQVPPALAGLIQFAADLTLAAYSPQYDPQYAPQDNGPAAQARRQGGIVLRGAMRFGRQLGLTVSSADAQLTVLPADGFPRLRGQFTLTSNAGLPSGLPALQQASLAFDSQPAANQPLIEIAGSINGSLPLGNSLTIQPATGQSLSARFAVLRQGASFGFALTIAPALFTLPLFGGNTQVRIYGADRTQPFTMATQSTWTATASLENLTLVDPLHRPLLRIDGPLLTGQVNGNKLSWDSLVIARCCLASLRSMPVILRCPGRPKTADWR